MINNLHKKWVHRLFAMSVALHLTPAFASDGQHQLTLPALTFQGSDLRGRSCQLNVSGYFDKGDFRYLAKVNYRIHGVNLVDMQPSVYRYDIDTNSYRDRSSDKGVPALVSVLLSDRSIDADPHLIEKYQKEKSLKQFMRLDFFDMDLEAFEAGLQSVLTTPDRLSDSISLLDQLNQAVLVVFHRNHYDSGFCTGFRLQNQIKAVEFTIEVADDDHGDDDDDDDHDHDHDGDHDHRH